MYLTIKEATITTIARHKRSWVLLLLSILVSSCAILLAGTLPALSQPPASGDWFVTAPETVANQTITLDGNLVVSTTGRLTLTNVTLAMDCASDGEYGITVEPGGSLRIADSVITAAAVHGFDFAVHGAAFEMIDSELHGAGWGPEQELGDPSAIVSGQRGLVIGTDGAALEGNTISHNHVGVILTGAGVTLTNNTIVSNTVHGIYIQAGTDNHILSNTIRHGGHASSPIRLHGASGNRVASNTIRSSIHRGIIETFESQGNRFEHNDIAGKGIGVLMMFVSNDNVVRENTIAVDEAGVMAWGWGNEILSNTISSKEGLFPIGTGVYMVYAYNSEVRGNRITGVSEEHGIWLRNASGNVIAGNTASAALTGIPRASVGLLLNNHSHHNVAYGNTFTGFDRGLGLFYDSDANVIAGNAFSATVRESAIVDRAVDNAIYRNNFLDPGLPPYDGEKDGGKDGGTNDGQNAWDDGSHGNYWSDHDGSGAYPVPPSGSDRFPLEAPVEIGTLHLPDPTPIAAPSLSPLFSRAITQDTEITNQALNLGWIAVQGGARLTLNNVTLTTGGGATASSIEVAPGGSLHIRDSAIAHLENGVGFQMNMRAGSHFVMRDSHLTGCGHEWWYGGVHFYGDDFLLERNAITDTMLTIFGRFGGRVVSNTVARSYQAVDLENSGTDFISNTFRGSIRPAINGAGADNVIQGNTVVDVWGNGLYVWSCPRCRIAGNTISGVPHGFAGIRTAGVDVPLTGNTVADAHVGLWLDQALTATHNTVTGCHTGIVALGDGGHVEDNDLSGCAEGMWLGGNGYTVVSNTFSGNRTGLSLTLTCDQNLIYGNAFADNATQAYDGSALIFENHWDNGSRGNRWSDYAGLDTDGDGIGETPYAIPPHEGRQDRYPLVETRRVFLPLVLRER